MRTALKTIRCQMYGVFTKKGECRWVHPRRIEAERNLYLYSDTVRPVTVEWEKGK
jgi:hypothetical protein